MLRHVGKRAEGTACESSLSSGFALVFQVCEMPSSLLPRMSHHPSGPGPAE